MITAQLTLNSQMILHYCRYILSEKSTCFKESNYSEELLLDVEITEDRMKQSGL